MSWTDTKINHRLFFFVPPNVSSTASAEAGNNDGKGDDDENCDSAEDEPAEDIEDDSFMSS